jgi:protein-L-isoaspartate(D-aspartate) O-methyltransferase
MISEKKKYLINHLEKSNYIKSVQVKKAFEKVPREQFIPEVQEEYAYADTPLSIGSGQTISAPHMIAIMVEALDLSPGLKVLEIGTGSGYHAAIVSRIIKDDGHVYSIERYTELADKARNNLDKAGIENVTVEVGDGSKGLSKYQPYDRIYVTCAAPSIPNPYMQQLNDPGIILIPVGRTYCELVKFEKQQGKVTSKNLGGCAFVPLIGKYGH